MEIFEIILYVLAYSFGIITIFLEVICYNKKIEYLETIIFSIAFLFFIVALSISVIFGQQKPDAEGLNNLVLCSMILLGLTTPLNIFAERQVKIPKSAKYLLYIVSAILLLLLIARSIDFFDFHTQTIITSFLLISIALSMLLIRNTKPEKRIVHREKSERIFAIVTIIMMPIALIFEFLVPDISPLPFTIVPPILFILLSTSKILDDINRLSLFKNENSILDQNAKNFNLTPREKEIADLLVKGQSYAKISESLFIAMPTVKTHVSNIYKKVEVNNKIELLYALIR